LLLFVLLDACTPPASNSINMDARMERRIVVDEDEWLMDEGER